MRKLATDKHETVVGVPEVVRLTIVNIEPMIVTIAIHVEHVQIAIGIVAYKIPPIPPLFDFSKS
ncbi:MAG: hypothetical protein ABIA11_04225 [Patescibacteria group bacterium]